MNYVPNILIRRSRAPSDVFTVTHQATPDVSFRFVPNIPASYGPLLCDWGDGTSEEWTTADNNTAKNHTYSSSGTYVCSLQGSMYSITVGNPSYPHRVTGCNYNWGAIGIAGAVNMFQGCSELVTPLPSLPMALYCTSMFKSCIKLTLAPGFVIPGNVINMQETFFACPAISVDINDLGSSFPSLNNINGIFRYCTNVYGDATAFKNKCSASVTYVSAFEGTNCTNIPA